MTEMARHRLQLYAKSAKLRALRTQIDALECQLWRHYRERERLERATMPRRRTTAKKKKPFVGRG
jgi:hypothetical protein